MALLYPFGVSFQYILDVFWLIEYMVKYNFHWTFAFSSIICLTMIGYYCISVIFNLNGWLLLMCILGITYYSLNLMFKYIWYPNNMVYVLIILSKLVLGNHNDIKPRRLFIWLCVHVCSHDWHIICTMVFCMHGISWDLLLWILL